MDRAARRQDRHPTNVDTSCATADDTRPQSRGERERERERPAGFLEEWLRNARDRREERRREREERKEEQRNRALEGKEPARGKEAPAQALTRQGAIDEMKLPKQFHKVDDKNVKPDWQETRTEYAVKGAPGTKICYSRQEGWAPSKDCQDSMKKIMADPAHRLTPEEVDAISEAIPKPPFGTRGSFTVAGLSTKKIGNENVLVMELSNDNTDRRVYGYFFNAAYSQGANAAGTLESVWFEANGKNFSTYQKDALASLHSVRFKN